MARQIVLLRGINLGITATGTTVTKLLAMADS